MPSSNAQILRAASEIRRNGDISSIPCDRCLTAGIDCYVMPSDDPNARLKCAECVRQKKPCVNLSWTSLDRTREEYQKKVDEDEKLLAQVMTRLLRNKQILKQANERARRKTQCLLAEIDASGEAEVDDDANCPAADATVGFSPLMWSTLAMMDEFTTDGTGQGVAGSS
jgi:hypothetical protein